MGACGTLERIVTDGDGRLALHFEVERVNHGRAGAGPPGRLTIDDDDRVMTTAPMSISCICSLVAGFDVTYTLAPSRVEAWMAKTLE
jgi:hypothetical protein